MNPISLVTGVITHPRRTVEGVAGATYGVASAGLRTTARVVGWAVERSAGRTPEPSDALLRTVEPPVPTTTVPQDFREEPPAKKAPAEKAPAQKAPARKATARKAPAKKAASKKAASKKAAVVAPALGLTEAEVVDAEPLLDPATVKAAASEAEMMQRAADPDKG